MSANNSRIDTEALQLALPGTDDVHFVLNYQTVCVCGCDECPPWRHEKARCMAVCASQRTEKTPLTNRGVI